jgi:hypothetical protein
LLQYLTWRKPAIASVRSIGKDLIKIQTEAVRQQVLSAVDRMITRLPPESVANTVEIEVSRGELLGAIEEPTEFAFVSERLRDLLGVKEGEISSGARAMLYVPVDELRQRDAAVSLELGYAQRSLRMRWTAGEPEVSLSVQLRSDEHAEAMRERAGKLLRAFAQRFLSMGMVLVLPSERKALASTYKQIPDNGTFEEVLSRPVAAFVNFLATTEAMWRTRKETEMSSALGHLNAQILGGSVQFQGDSAETRLVFMPRNGPALPMHATSSMVRSLAGLGLYLRYGARKAIR